MSCYTVHLRTLEVPNEQVSTGIAICVCELIAMLRLVGIVAAVVVLFWVALVALGSAIGSIELLIWFVLLVATLIVVIRKERARSVQRQ
jgi:hypothetical protein